MSLDVSEAGRRYGYLPGPRSYPLAKVTMKLAQAPVRNLITNNRPFLGPVKDQTILGCCTGEAACGDGEYLFRRFKHQAPVFSPLFTYQRERNEDGSLNEGDCGSTGNTSCMVSNKEGLCLEELFPFNPANYQNTPTPEALASAAAHKLGAYHSVMNLDDIRTCLNSGYCVRIGFNVYESFESSETANKGIFKMPNKAIEANIGGHEVLAFDCDDVNEIIWVRNSWGSSWGLQGNFKMPYAAIQDRDIFLDGRMQHFGKPWGK